MPDQGVRSLDFRQNDFRRTHALQVFCLLKSMRPDKHGYVFIQAAESPQGE